MVTELKISPKRGGNRHPLSVRTFILDHLAAVEEDYGANIHRAYKTELRHLAERNRLVRGKRGIKVRYYHNPSSSSFSKKMNLLAREGLIEFSGREEESDNPMFANLEWKPIRRYYRLTSQG